MTNRICCNTPETEAHAKGCPFAIAPFRQPRASDDARARESVGPFTVAASCVFSDVAHVACAESPAAAQQIADALNMLHKVRAGTAGVGASLGDEIMKGGDPAEFALEVTEFGALRITFGPGRQWCLEAAEALHAAGWQRVRIPPASAEVEAAFAECVCGYGMGRQFMRKCIKALRDRGLFIVTHDDIDPPAARVHLPDGSLPANAREAAEGWRAAYERLHGVFAEAVSEWEWVQARFDRGDLPEGLERADVWGLGSGDAARLMCNRFEERAKLTEADLEVSQAANRQWFAETANLRRMLGEAETRARRAEALVQVQSYDDTWPNWKLERPFDDRAVRPPLLLTLAGDTPGDLHALFASAVAMCGLTDTGAPDKAEPFPSHPVDAFKAIAERAGFTVDPAWESTMREICDEPIALSVFASGEYDLPGDPILRKTVQGKRVYVAEAEGVKGSEAAARSDCYGVGCDEFAMPGRTRTVDLPGVTSRDQAERIIRHRHDRGWPKGDMGQGSREESFGGDGPLPVDQHAPYRAEGHNVLTKAGLMVASCGALAIGSLAQRKVGNMAHAIADALNAVTTKGGEESPFARPVPAMVVQVQGGGVPLNTLVALVTAQVERTLERRNRRAL